VPFENSAASSLAASFPYYAKFVSGLIDLTRLVAIYFDESWDEVRHEPLYGLGQEFPEMQFRVLERSDFGEVSRFNLSLETLPTFAILSMNNGSYYPFDALRGVDISDASWLGIARGYAASVLNGSLPMQLLTEDVSERMNRGPLVRLSRATFAEFVADTEVHTVILFFSNSTTENVDTEALESAADVVKQNGGKMKFGFINLWRNAFDIRLPFLMAIPQVTLFPMNKTMNWTSYWGLHTKDGLLRFFKGNSDVLENFEPPRITKREADMDEPRVLSRSTPPPFLPDKMGSEMEMWRIEKHLNCSSRFSHFFMVTSETRPSDKQRYILKTTYLNSMMISRQFEHEVEVLTRLGKSVHFPHLQHAFRLDGQFSIPIGCIVMTYAERGNLHDLKLANMSNQRRWNLTCGMAEAVAAVHKSGFVHDDIKLINFVLTADDVVQLIDFQSSWPLKDPSWRIDAGTVAFDSPERAISMSYEQPSDAWALGVVIWNWWEALLYLPPFASLMFYGEQLPFTCATPPEIREVIRKLLIFEPEERMTAHEAALALRALRLPSIDNAWSG
jgi:hypothetical protein